MREGEYIPERGDLVWINFNPQAGHEQAGRRPAVVLSPFAYNDKVGLAIFCPVTNKIKGYPFEVSLPEDVGISGAVLSDHVKSLDWRIRDISFIKKLSPGFVEEVSLKLNLLIQTEGP